MGHFWRIGAPRSQLHVQKLIPQRRDADEVLFGRLKAGGHVRVVVVKDEDGVDKLGFEYLDGPVTPKPEKIPRSVSAKPKRRPGSSSRRKPPGPKGGGDEPPRRGSVPKVPLVKA
jgi:ATP-dependent Clp protease ATP-binding subunit ClpA